MKNNAHVLQRFNDTPSLVAPQYVSAMQAFANSEPRGAVADTEMPYDEMCASWLGLAVTSQEKSFVFSDGLAVIPVYGLLLHRDSYVSEHATGYDYIRARLAMALSDPDVTGIVFDLNSYGGQAVGNFELCDMIYAARGHKPMIALVDSQAYSGGYSIASSTDKIVAAPSASVGSIGVVMTHVSYETALNNQGVKVTYIFAGDQKVDGNSTQDLSPATRKRYQKSVDKSYEAFVALVARNRALDPEIVRNTEAGCFDADEALTLGLIDAIQTPTEALAAFRMELSGSNTYPQNGVKHMTTPNTVTAAGGDSANVAPVAPVAAPTTVAAIAATEAANPTEEAVRKAERDRVESITSSEHAKGKESLAAHLAFKTDMAASDAIATLIAAPAATAAAPATSPFVAAMDNTQNPNVGAGGDGTENNEPELSRGEQLAESWAKQTGFKLRSVS